MVSFELKRFKKLKDLKVLDADMPLEIHKNCPCCIRELKTVSILSGKDKEIRIGGCANCGYLGYIDRPAKQWLDEFYRGQWRADQGEIIPRPEKADFKKLDAILNMCSLLKDDNILEIGVGKGMSLGHLKSLGYSKLFGVENSRHLAEAAEKHYGVEVINLQFENGITQRILNDKKPFQLIFSYHVLEHTYNPDEVMSLCSSLENEGGYLAIAVPNIEPVPLTIFYLPHLHRFTLASLVNLFSRYGYEIIGNITGPAEFYLLARKTKQARKVINGNYQHYFDKLLSKFQFAAREEKILWWNRELGREGIGIKPITPRNKIYEWYFNFRNQGHKQEAVVQFLGNKEILEIKFQDKIKLLYK